MFRTMLATTLLMACITIARTDILDDCKIPNIFPGIQPLLLQRNAFDQITFLYPNHNNGMITILPGHVVYLVCPGKMNYFTEQIFGLKNEVMAVCKKNTKFEVDGYEVDIRSLTCRGHSDQVGQYVNKLSCPTERRVYASTLTDIKPVEIGFHTKMGFIRTIELCFDTRYRQTLMTYMKMSKMIGTIRNSDVRRSSFRNKFYRGIDIENAYKFDTQLSVMSSILGTSLAQKLLQSGKQYLTRGHLVAKADFVYVEQQRSTFWYVNTAPQWKSFNQGNWQKLENSVRRFVKNRHLDLDVYTGTDDIMTIEDAQGNQRPIFLVDPVVANSKIYVPRFFWKIIYDPLSKRGTAFVGVNDPFIKSLTKDVVLCDDISDKITWLDWTPNEIELGLSYACSIDNLRESWMWLPPLDVDGILM